MTKVYLTGAGPGDPELITLKGRRVLAKADVVLYDHLANPALLEHAPASAERIYVGKKRTDHALSQEEICALLIEHARAGKTVVRLKGGDPYIFGRGGEEAEALAHAGIPFEVIPGVTAALGIASYSGVPLTHRGHTSVVTFVTGHDVDQIDWGKTGAADTLVFFMGLTTFGEIAERLIAAGRRPDTPAIAVRWGTRPDQLTVSGTLATLPHRISKNEMKPPATIIVGEVVSLHETLGWFERLPLFGQTIVNTRPAAQAAGLSEPLRELGANVVELPAIEIQPAADNRPLDHAIENLSQYDWLAFTSVNGVRFFLDRLDASAIDLRAIQGRLCAIGPATRSALEQLHLKVDLTGEEYVAESLVEAFTRYDLTGSRILLPRAAVARDVLPKGLSQLGAQVDVVEAYRTVAPANLAERAREVFKTLPEWVTFSSSSTVENLVNVLSAKEVSRARVASIGPITSSSARNLGVQVSVEALSYTATGLADAILRAVIIGS